jgi:FkbM family methyltransferase
MGSQVFFRGTYSGDQLEVLCNLLQPGDLFVDGGANQGEFTVLAASLVGPSGKVLAFEPVSRIRERLTLNISLNSFQNVDVLALGLGDKSEVNVPIFDSHETFRDGTMHEGLFSLYVHHLVV